MKCMNVGVVLSTVVALGVIGAGCDKNKTGSAKKSTPEVKVESPVKKAEPKVAQEKAPAWLKEYFGDKLIKADGSEVSPDTLAGKTIGIYFSAHWCPPCRGFTPVLVKTYNELKAAGKDFDIVFVSSDRTAEEMANYMTEMKMPWKAVPYTKRDIKQALGNKYGVQGIPTLIVVDKDGKTISKSGRMDIISKGVAAFDDWK